MGKELYEERLKRIQDAISLKEPDCVPCMPFVQTYPFLHAGYSMADVLYDAGKAKIAIKKYTQEYQPDMAFGYRSVFAGAGPIMETLGINWLQWAGRPGSHVDKNSVHQYIEKPYLQDDEYKDLLSDLSGWILRKWLPRSFTSLKSLEKIDIRSMMGFGYLGAMADFADKEVMEAFGTLGKTGEMISAWLTEGLTFEQELENMGYPVAVKATTTTAFDKLSDTLRGTLDTMADLYEQPENVKAAVELFFPGTLFGAITQAKASNGHLVFIPLHKGMDGFMSNPQYEEFYWNTLKRLILGLIEHGLTPWVYTEGKYNSRLECLTDIPKGKILYHFEDVNMSEAKKIVGPYACISGGLRSSLLTQGTKQQVIDEVKHLLDICAPGGGYIFDISDTMDDCKPENIEAMFDTIKTCGKY